MVSAGGSYLDTPDAAASVDHDVVMLVVAKRLGHGQSMGGGLKHEVQFGEIANVI